MNNNFQFEKDFLFVDSVISENENKDTAIELKVLVDISNEEIISRFNVSIDQLKKLKEISLVAFVTVNKYKKIINYINFEIESVNLENVNINLRSPLSFVELENFRKICLQEIARNYYQKK